MNSNSPFNLFQIDPRMDINQSKLSDGANRKNKEESQNEHNTSYILTLRKKKYQKELYLKRKLEFIASNKNYYETQEKIEYTYEDFFNGKIYNDLKNSYIKNDEKKTADIIYSMTQALINIQIDHIFSKKLFPDDDSSLNTNGELNNKDNLPILITEICFNTKKGTIFQYGFDLILNFSYISNTFCRKITNEKNINKIFNRLIYFYPLFAIINNSDSNIEEESQKKDESYYFGSIIIKLLGNLFVSSNSHEAFEVNNFYSKIFLLLSVFDLDYKNKERIAIRYEYLDTLLWLANIIIEFVEGIALKYSDIILNIIPNLLDIIRAFYYTEETEILNRIIYFIESISYIRDDLIIKIVESKGIANLINLFGYLFTTDKNSGETVLTSEIINKIISIFINIFTLDSKYLQNIDYSQFALVIERLLSLYRLHHSNHFDIQSSLINLLSNLACFNDIEGIVNKILLNNNIIKYLFNYYNKYHLSEVLWFLDNMAEKQLKKVRDYILNMGGFEIIKNTICNYNEDNKNIIEKSIGILYKIIEAEKAFNIRLLFEKLYQNSIPEKIKDFYLNVNYSPEFEVKIKSIIKDFETYEKSLDN